MRKNTKEAICQAALHLFSIHGYEGVSTKAIADAVGIKDSSLYNHFKSKQAIFDELQTRYQQIAEAMMIQLELSCEINGQADSNSFHAVSDVFFEKYLMDNFCNKFIRVMRTEQYKNSVIQHLYTKWMLDIPLQFQSKIFNKISLPALSNTTDYEYLALKFYAPLYLYTDKYLLNGELTEEKKNLFRMAAGKHIQFFMQEMGWI